MFHSFNVQFLFLAYSLSLKGSDVIMLKRLKFALVLQYWSSEQFNLNILEFCENLLELFANRSLDTLSYQVSNLIEVRRIQICACMFMLVLSIVKFGYSNKSCCQLPPLLRAASVALSFRLGNITLSDATYLLFERWCCQKQIFRTTPRSCSCVSLFLSICDSKEASSSLKIGGLLAYV